MTRARRRPAATRATTRAAVQLLEPRTFLTATVLGPVPAQSVTAGQTSSAIALGSFFNDPTIPAGDTAVNLVTNLPAPNTDIPLYLTDAATPKTVANFLRYITSGEYANTIIHRAIPGFVIQGGGYTTDGTHIATFGTVTGESTSAVLKNTTGTIAMALSTGPNSGTSEFFFNLADNANLDDTSNGGPFTAFGALVYDGLAHANAVAALNIVNDSAQVGAWDTVPTQDTTVTNGATVTSVPAADLVTINPVVVAGGLTYTVTSSDPSLVTPTVTDGSLTLATVAGSTAGGSATVTITATDLGGTSVTSTVPVTVLPVATISVTAPDTQRATAGTAASFSLGSFTEANGTAPYTVSVNWGDGTAPTTFTTSDVGDLPAQTHTYAAAATTTTVSVVVTDAGQTPSNTATFGVTVAAPVGISPAVAKSTVPTAVVTGAATKGVVTLSLTNTTGAATTRAGTTTVRLYAVNAANVLTPTSGTLLGTALRRGSISATRPTKVAVRVNTVLPTDTYTLVAVSTDSTGRAVTQSAGPALTVSAGFVSLATTVGTVTPAFARAGGAVTIVATVTNNGNVAATGVAGLTVTAAVSGSSPVTLTATARKVTIRPGGKSVTLRIRAKVPAGTATGSYVPTVTVKQGSVTAPAATGTVPFAIS